MRITAFAIGFCLILGGCTKMQNTTSQAMDDVQDGTSTSWHKMRQDLDLEAAPKPKTRPAQTRYCYKTIDDVVCYGSPLVGQESRLLAYQDKNSVGYVIDPPKPAVDKKKKKGDAAKPDTTPLPPLDAAPAAPVSDTPPATNISPVDPSKPAEVKKDDKKLKEITFDPSELEPKELVPNKLQ